MAESQLLCLDDGHVNEKVPESRPDFYYSEEQRAAVEQLLRNGDGAFKMRLKEDNVKDFLSAREIKLLRKILIAYDTDSDNEQWETEQGRKSEVDSKIPSTYWPQLSDTEVPVLDIGWPEGGFYKGVTRVSVYTHPPKDNGPRVKEVVRRMIQDSNKVIAVVMDLLTDLQILQDMLDAISRRSVSVYIVLEASGVPHLLDMLSRLQVTAMHLRNMRVRSVQGCGLPLSLGRLPGSLCSKYMLVDIEKVMFGSYSFTWTSSRMDRNLITIMTGQVVDMFDNDFRELYAVSEEIDLYKEFHVAKPPLLTPIRPAVERRPPPVASASASRFQVALANHSQTQLMVPAHKYHNPKYSLVVGNNLGLTGSLQDLSAIRDKLAMERTMNIQPAAVHTSSEKLGRLSPPLPSSGGAENSSPTKPNVLAGWKPKASFRNFLKGKSANQNGLMEGEHSPVASKHSPIGKVSESPNSQEQEDSFELIFSENAAHLKGRFKKTSKLNQKSVSLQAINTQGEDGRRRHSKKTCIQS